MQTSHQDKHYLSAEADAFHERNHASNDPHTLRPSSAARTATC